MTPPRTVWCVDLGLMDFSGVHALQLKIIEARLSETIDRDVILILEHPGVFTLGRRGNLDHLKVSKTFLDDAGMAILPIERGGDITFHGPGQLVLYPIFHLRKSCLGVVDFVEKLEEVMMRTADDMGVSALRDHRNHGVWVDNRKLGFVGIAVRRFVTFHGISLNVDLSLEPFTWIYPCGLKNIHVTSLKQETGKRITVDEVKPSISQHFENIFSVNLQYIDKYKLKDLIN